MGGGGLADCYIELFKFTESTETLALVTCYTVTLASIMIVLDISFVVLCNSFFSSGDFSLT